MDLEVIVDKSLFFSDLKCKTKEEVISFLAEELTKKGFVKESYKTALLEREGVYPTGLPSNGFNIAIPHADYTLVNQTTIAIGILENPVTFYSMENIEKPLDISIVIMLAIDMPHGQIEMLQRIVQIIQDDSLRQALVENYNEESVNKLLQYLNGGK
ncbi:PTS sugar transporter subunit IIA [Streptococcus sp. zg-86]|uniref:PTS sugar transporter subunit IIA n=1 Tax=Streptococcus zhangguiae TaxID=2664091 RepID=A0A6I4RDE1_9STRE|nr:MULTISPECIES: PTS sugar transporter subunit IIA [unclassified Streptococcus]MTB64749.1 PTS sugar transporter subunit IIA [Streptococcus sp. zg-86]MTB91321.1 PTS sugar transporter subunit IIA [Streptococcus sp. zg-36]MWV56748.1 PTS sugar transporter subunit IIA [Streptococcus sp. zg-70]QTH48480.1 PTS sugar transporter subunit IIA [Streptococcus sp. zg-86]